MSENKKKLLCIIDMQNSFIHPKGILSIEGAYSLVDKFNTFLSSDKYGSFFDGALLTQDTHFRSEYEQSEESKEFPFHCEYLSFDWELAINIEQIKQKIPVYLMYKNVFDMWKECINNVDNNLSEQEKIGYNKLFKPHMKDITLSLEDFLNKYSCREFDIYLCGVASDYCVKYALDGFLKKGFNVILLESLIQGIHKDIKLIIKSDYYKEYLQNGQLKIMQE